MLKSIIFDLCGPVITIDVDLISRRMEAFGAPSDGYTRLRQAGLTKLFEEAAITPAAFCYEVRKILDCNITDKQIFDAWNTLIVSFPRKHIDFLESIKGRYRLFLLSNSDVVNAKYFTDELNRRAGYDFVGTVFERAYFSCELKMRKPDPAIFKYIIEKHNLNPSETLFVDDCLKHIDSAKSVGLQTCFMPAEDDISEMLIY